MKILKKAALAAVIALTSANMASAQSLGDILGGVLGSGQQSSQSSGLGNTIGNLLEGVFSSSNITVADLEGEWKASGPAVCFQSEGFLQQAGGKAAAAAIETKLDPYYQKYGLKNATLTVAENGTFTLVVNKIKLSGNITAANGAEKGVFDFNFTIMGSKLTSVTTYVEKTSTSMDVMFDATKLKTLLSAIGQFSGITIVKSLTSILDSYEGLCIGLNFKGGSTKTNSSTGLGILNSILGGGSQNNSGTTTNSTNSGTSNSGLKNGSINSNSGSSTNSTSSGTSSSGLKSGSINSNSGSSSSSSSQQSGTSVGADLLWNILNGGNKK